MSQAKQIEKEARIIAKKKGLILRADTLGKCLDILNLLSQNESYRAMVKVAGSPFNPNPENAENAMAEQQAK